MAEIVFIGDDFTGASDTLATLAERGARVRLFLDVPEGEETADLDAVGIATDLRAHTPEEIARRLGGLLPRIRALSPRFIHYKICSTFDSAPHIGSIGAAVLELETEFAPAHTVILGGQPSLGRHCIFGTLFARMSDGVVHRIDRHPVMSRHPVTPMAEADLRIHLRRQGLADIDLISHVQLQSGINEVAQALNRAGRTLVDAVGPSDVERIGRVLRDVGARNVPLLIVGASSVAEALRPYRIETALHATTSRARGPCLAVAGSRSSVTAAQVAAAESYDRLPLNGNDLGSGRAHVARRCAELLAEGRNVLIHLEPDVDYGMAPAALSERLAELAASIVDLAPVRAIAVAGGDTSSAVVERLGFRSLSFVDRAAAGVAICRGHLPGDPADGTLLLLKGGQVGDQAMLERFAAEHF